MALVMDGSTVEGGVADSAHTLTSVESVMSVMSEVRGDWGALVKVKDTDRVSGTLFGLHHHYITVNYIIVNYIISIL